MAIVPPEQKYFVLSGGKLPALQTPTFRYSGLDNRYRVFKTPAGNQCWYGQDEKAKT